MSSETFTCEACGETFPKGWSDADSSSRGGKNGSPALTSATPGEAGIVCDACYGRIMGRAQAEAPQLIGAGWREASEQFDRERGVSGKCYRTAGGSAVHIAARMPVLAVRR